MSWNSGIQPLVAARRLLAVLRIWACALLAGCSALFTAVRAVTGSLPDAVLPALAPLIGPFALSVIRPDLSGWALRAVAAAGPSAGVGSGLLGCLMLSSSVKCATSGDRACGLAGLFACAVHLANLTPRVPDGHSLWRGR